jgi:hypothetical protein
MDDVEWPGCRSEIDHEPGGAPESPESGGADRAAQKATNGPRRELLTTPRREDRSLSVSEEQHRDRYRQSP